eukprot:8798900-Pyramimonas_sp.AAC.1
MACCRAGSATSGGSPIASGHCPMGSGMTATGSACSCLQYCLPIIDVPSSGRSRAGTQNPPT